MERFHRTSLFLSYITQLFLSFLSFHKFYETSIAVFSLNFFSVSPRKHKSLFFTTRICPAVGPKSLKRKKPYILDSGDYLSDPSFCRIEMSLLNQLFNRGIFGAKWLVSLSVIPLVFFFIIPNSF